MSSNDSPILIIGGSGLVGSRTARWLRQRHPDVPLTIGGRGLERALAIARELGNATATVIDLAQPGLGLGAEQRFRAVIPLVKDDTLESLRYAQSIEAGYVSISSGVFEMAPEVAQYTHAPSRSAVVFASHWLVGAPTFAALHFAEEFRTIDAIDIGAVLDDRDIGGPAANADFERLTTMATSQLLRKDGQWRWVRGAEAERLVVDSAGVERQGQTYTPFDVLGLAAATNARSVRFDVVVGETPSRRRGEPPSTEMFIELRGEARSGAPLRVRHELVYPEGTTPLTALNLVLLIERLAGLTGSGPVPPGLYFPEQVVSPRVAFEEMQRSGLQHRRVER
jgi:hypothetical protein